VRAILFNDPPIRRGPYEISYYGVGAFFIKNIEQTPDRGGRWIGRLMKNADYGWDLSLDESGSDWQRRSSVEEAVVRLIDERNVSSLNKHFIGPDVKQEHANIILGIMVELAMRR